MNPLARGDLNYVHILSQKHGHTHVNSQVPRVYIIVTDVENDVTDVPYA